MARNSFINQFKANEFFAHSFFFLWPAKTETFKQTASLFQERRVIGYDDKKSLDHNVGGFGKLADEFDVFAQLQDSQSRDGGQIPIVRQKRGAAGSKPAEADVG